MPFDTRSEVSTCCLAAGAQNRIRSFPAAHIKVPEGYPPEPVLEGGVPKEDYNYVLVRRQPGQKTKFTLNRFRPWSAEPFATVELFGSSK